MSAILLTTWLALGLPAALPATKELSLSKLAPKPTAEPGAAETVDSTLDARYVARNGQPFVRLKSKDGVIYLPAVEHSSPDQLDEAFCANNAGGIQERNAELARVDRGLQNEWQPYAALVQQTIQTKCKNVVAGGPTPGADSGDTPVVTVNPMLEVGVSKDSKNKEGTATRTRIFTKPASGPNLNVGKDF